MDLEKVISALYSETRRKILKILAEGPMTVQETLNKLSQLGFKIKYRESIFRALEKLVNAELVEKFYDRKKGICYKLLIRRIEINLIKETVSGLSDR